MVKIRSFLNLLTYVSAFVSYICVLEYIPVYYSWAFLPLAGAAIYLEWRSERRIPRWVLNWISLAIIVLSLSKVSADLLVEPILGALVILVAVKLLEDKRFRDYMQIYALCMFLLIGSSLISFNIVFLAYFFILLFLLTVCMVLLAHFSRDSDMVMSDRSMVKIILGSLLLCVLSIPSTIFFFIILPRVSHPLFHFFGREGFARTGFSESVHLGSVSEIQENHSAIFRVEMEQVGEEALYWRGIVLDKFDGTSWKISGEGEGTEALYDMNGRRVHQVIYIEPYGNNYLFALDRPIHVFARGVRRSGGLVHYMEEGILQKKRYAAMSVLSDILPETHIDRSRYLELPPDFSPKIKKLTEDLISNRKQEEITGILTNHLKFGNYRYSLKDLPNAFNALEEFLLTRKQGTCEYFASSLAVMLRVAGIPARLVGGYRGGQYNATGKYYLVQQRNAHVWVEAYHNGIGWTRIDPTPYVPEAADSTYSRQLLRKFNMLMDTFNYYWNKLVLDYDLNRQLLLFHKIKSNIKRPEIQITISRNAFLRYFIYGLTSALLIYAVYGAVVFRRRTTSRLLDKFLSRMHRYGYTRNRNEGLEEFTRRITDEALRSKALGFVLHFESIYYKDGSFSPEEIVRLEKRILDM